MRQGRHRKSRSHEHLQDLRNRIEAALGRLASPTQEAAEQAVRDLLSSGSTDAAALVPFSGYYGLDNAPNAFFSIDTSQHGINYRYSPHITISLSVPVITINVCVDGVTSQSYEFDDGGSFDGTTLIIPQAQLNIVLTREYLSGQLVAASGTIQGISVSGSTYLNPVELAAFAARYTSVKTNTTVLTLGSPSAWSSSLEFDSGSGLQNVEFYTYNPSMYVIEFLVSTVPYVLMLGTQGPCGRVCFITSTTASGETTQDFAVTTPSPVCLASLTP
jgi:hypothetical protein